MALFVRSDGPVVLNIRCQTYEEAIEKWNGMKLELPNQKIIIEAEQERPTQTEMPPAPSRTGYTFKHARSSRSRPLARADVGHKSGNRGFTSGGGTAKKNPKRKQGRKH
jgi:hypothetical protein